MPLTLRAVSRCRDSIVTIMALQRAISEMVGEGHATVWTLEGEAAIRTEDKIGKPSSIQKEKALFFSFDAFLKCRPHLF
jgi:hypothetical protein